MKYIILYGGQYQLELYNLAKTLKEAKELIKDCREELGIHESEIHCYKIENKILNFTTKVTIK